MHDCYMCMCEIETMVIIIRIPQICLDSLGTACPDKSVSWLHSTPTWDLRQQQLFCLSTYLSQYPNVEGILCNDTTYEVYCCAGLVCSWNVNWSVDLCTPAWRRSSSHGGPETRGAAVSAYIRRTKERGQLTCAYSPGSFPSLQTDIALTVWCFFSQSANHSFYCKHTCIYMTCSVPVQKEWGCTPHPRFLLYSMISYSSVEKGED